ncbi:unnamed protein product [Didymodactylos carnosus]|uniref:Alkaline ceramidase n=1 Tax=Didymodactylos carnosus TaxID=1234261 RepID=A0A813WVU7_9BILA|nr:unnamed protein product [Didymodactylos carnosus]CAF0861242.1 unnamed protein product [Didymodactylos carnosus]CAF3540717.1 unnamed protein product [Didymodactylos carnosus]CAF3648908.1 unnamed protein product [Didymodactylos carnosus]
MIALFRPYTKKASNSILILWILLIFVGIGSLYFHATLSLAGQLLDEICILWVLMAGYALFLPSIYLPQSWRLQRYRFVYGCIIIAIVITSLSVVYPYANAFALMLLGLPAIAFMGTHIARCDNRRIKDLGIRCLVLWTIAVTIWICDRVFCPFWLSISFPYLHAIWHVLIIFSSNQAIVICSYLIIKQNYPQIQLNLHYWPYEHWEYFGIPYVKFANDVDLLTSHNIKAVV